jgi:hypothetical protein
MEECRKLCEKDLGTEASPSKANSIISTKADDLVTEEE